VIRRVYLKSLISFESLELNLTQGLVVFSGPSGAGKSILMNSILATFGYATAEARLCEVTIDKPTKLLCDAYEFDEEITLKSIKKEKVRYYIDGQNISKKSLRTLFSPFVRYLSVRDRGGFESRELLEMIDRALSHHDRAFKKLKKEYQRRYARYRHKQEELERINAQESQLATLMEFTQFEIEKITAIDPKVEEEQELLTVKHQLSRIDKINEALSEASGIFAFEASVNEVYRLLERENSGFEEMMNQLRADFEDVALLADELAEVDIEGVLDRLEKLSELKNRYGSIEGALAYLDTKKKELASFQNLEVDKGMLETFLEMEGHELLLLATQLRQFREQEARRLEEELIGYLDALKLPPLGFVFDSIALSEMGIDRVDLDLDGSTALTLSGGEFNRLRLALMVVTMVVGESQGGVLILDEIDANVSGDESIAIANMVAKLSEVYQVFAISHQAHLASKAKQHILVSKSGGKSEARSLDHAGRVAEIARIIGGENPNIEAVQFAQKLID